MNDVRMINNFRFNCGALKDNEMYFFPEIANALMKINIDSLEISSIPGIAGHVIYENRRAEYMCAYEDNIFAVDEKGEYIEKINPAKKEAEYVALKDYHKTWGNFVYVTNQNGKIYMFPIDKPELHTLDMKEMKHVDIRLYKQLEGHEFTSGCQSGNIVILYAKQSPWIAKYDLIKETLTITNLGNRIEGCMYATCDNENLYILTNECHICKWNIALEQIEKIVDITAYSKDEDTYEFMDLTDEKIIVLPKMGKEILLIDIRTGSIEIFTDYPKDFRYTGDHNKVKFSRAVQDGEYYYHTLKRANYLLKIHRKSGEVQWCKPVFISKEDKLMLYRECAINTFGDEVMSMEELVELSQKKEQKAGMKTIGSAIWEML